jgi:type VI secretion system protein ImpL
MNFISDLIRSRWVRTLAGVALLGVIIWFFGPLLGVGALHPLETETARIIAIALLLLLWLIENLIHLLRARNRDKALAEGIAKAPRDPTAAATAEEVAALSERLGEALAALKRSRIGGPSGRIRGARRYLYQLPWYMFIGPPGAGKTTALVNSGLKFPLADTPEFKAGGPAAVRGVGGTRNCDWWFTDQAVLIDTAGRYTTQDSDAAVDSAAWLGFLRLLKQHRKRQPLNGVLVAISLSDLATLGEAERMAHAAAIRRRIRELNDELGVRIPTYVLFTKADLLAGFVEFFDGLGREEREQVWGVTFKLEDAKDKSEGGTVAAFLPEFDKLLERLNDRMLEREQQETDLQRRRLIYGFPQQLASLREVAGEFLTEVFRPSRLETRPLLRGVYFTSGTQDGTPIDRLLGAMASEFGLQRQAVAAFSGTGRSFFLARLLREVVFGEAGLVSLDPKVERRQRLIQIGAYATAALVLLLLTGFWTVSYFGNRAMIAAAHESGARYEQQYAALLKRGPLDAELPAVLPALATLRSMRGGYDDRQKSTPLALTFGLYQGEKLSAAAVETYERALNGLLLPRLLARLERQLQTHLDQPDFLYQALKVYLILGRQGPLDRDLVTAWLGADFTASFPGEENAELRAALATHLQALLERPLTALPLNAPLVAEARAVLTRQPLAEYVYTRMLRSGVVQGLPAWTIEDNAGPLGGRVFALRDGKPLATGMPGIFTYDGYHTAFLLLLPSVTTAAAENDWVLGRQQAGGLVGSVNEMKKLRQAVVDLYLTDYTRRWDDLLANIALKPFGDVAQGRDELFALSGPDSPLRDLLQAVDRQTQLSRPAAAEQLAGQAETKGAKVAQKLGGFASYLAGQGMTFEQAQIADVLSVAFGTDASGKPVDPASRVDEHFRALHDFVVGSKDKPAQLEAVLAKLLQLYQNLDQVANATNKDDTLLKMLAAGGGSGASAAAQVKEIAKDAPKPVAGMLQTVAASSTAVTAGGASEGLADAWRAKVLPLCQAAFDRYPFIRGSAADVPADDFTHLLGPNGLMDQFFEQYLKPFVDTSATPWHWQASEGANLGLSAGALGEFQHAADIRDALFASGGAQISVKFQLVPAELDPSLAQVSLELGGQRLAYAHGPTEPMDFQWPGSNGSTLVRLTMTPANGGAPSIFENSGAWSLLRLIDQARVTPSGAADRFRIAFTGAGGSAAFELNAKSVRNPFTLAALRAFRCPAKL